MVGQTHRAKERNGCRAAVNVVEISTQVGRFDDHEQSMTLREPFRLLRRMTVKGEMRLKNWIKGPLHHPPSKRVRARCMWLNRISDLPFAKERQNCLENGEESTKILLIHAIRSSLPLAYAGDPSLRLMRRRMSRFSNGFTCENAFFLFFRSIVFPFSEISHVFFPT